MKPIRNRDMLMGQLPRQSPEDARLLAEHNTRALVDAEVTIRLLRIDRARLVEALRQMIGAHGNVAHWWETEGEHRFQNQIDNLNLPRPTAEVIRQQVTDETAALLRDLGELGK